MLIGFHDHENVGTGGISKVIAQLTVHGVSKNDTDVAQYNFNVH